MISGRWKAKIARSRKVCLMRWYGLGGTLPPSCIGPFRWFLSHKSQLQAAQPSPAQVDPRKQSAQLAAPPTMQPIMQPAAQPAAQPIIQSPAAAQPSLPLPGRQEVSRKTAPRQRKFGCLLAPIIRPNCCFCSICQARSVVLRVEVEHLQLRQFNPRVSKKELPSPPKGNYYDMGLDGRTAQVSPISSWFFASHRIHCFRLRWFVHLCVLVTFFPTPDGCAIHQLPTGVRNRCATVRASLLVA